MNGLAGVVEGIASAVRRLAVNLSDLLATSPTPAFGTTLAAVRQPVSAPMYRSEALPPSGGAPQPQDQDQSARVGPIDADPIEAWAVASALEVLANYFAARPGRGGVQFRALATSVYIKAEHDVGDNIAHSLRAWAETIKGEIAERVGGHSLPPDGALFIWDPVAEAERTVRAAQADQEACARLDRSVELYQRIQELLGPEVGELLSELDGLHGQDLCDAEYRALYIAADVLKEARQWPLFARIYAEFCDGSHYEAGDEVDFYYRRGSASAARSANRRESRRIADAERQSRQDQAGQLPKPTRLSTWRMYVAIALGGHRLGDATCTVDDCGAQVDGEYPKNCPDGCGGLVHNGYVAGGEWAKCDNCDYRSDPMGWSFDSEGRLIDRGLFS
jgi:hypothetical protein